VPWGLFLRSAPVWAIIVAHFCYNWGYYTLLAWLPSYFELSLGLSVEGSSLLTLIPYVSMTAMTPFVGPVADALVARGWSITRVRKLAQVGTPPPAGCPQGAPTRNTASSTAVTASLAAVTACCHASMPRHVYASALPTEVVSDLARPLASRPAETLDRARRALRSRAPRCACSRARR